MDTYTRWPWNMEWKSETTLEGWLDLGKIYTDSPQKYLFVSWEDAREILGHPHQGTPEDDGKILNYFGISSPEGFTEETGLYFLI